MRLLLVDDERLILEELITITDWKRIGISHIETAGNVEQAKGIIRNHRPDIILCDIEMPQSSGLELLAWCKDNAPETETIIFNLSCAFSYAQTAVRLGSLDYLLKPVTEDTLIRVIRSVEEKIQRRRWEEEFSKYGEMWDAAAGILEREILGGSLFGKNSGKRREEWKREAEKRNLCDELKDNVVPILYRYHYDQAIGETAPEGLRRRGLRDWLEQEGRKAKEVLLAPKTGLLLIEANSEEEEGNNLRELAPPGPLGNCVHCLHSEKLAAGPSCARRWTGYRI